MNMNIDRFALNLSESTYTDKLLAKRVIERLQLYMRKKELTREDIYEILYLLTSEELKVLNFNEFDRYVLGKFYAWIRDFMVVADKIYQWYEKETDEKIKKYLEKSKKEMESVIRFLVDVFLYLARSTLSKEAKAFDTLSKQRIEYIYPQTIEQAQKPLPYLWLFRR